MATPRPENQQSPNTTEEVFKPTLTPVTIRIGCDIDGCRKMATYGPNRDNPRRCVVHKDKFKRCSDICRCGVKKPAYNHENTLPAVCCKLCKTEDMVDVRSKKCICGGVYVL